MTLLLVFVASVFTLFALWLTISPFVTGTGGLQIEQMDAEVRELEQLTARRAVLLTALRELELDRETNKLADADYERFRKRYEAEAVKILRRIDEIHGGRDWRDRVEHHLAMRFGADEAAE